MSSVIVHWMRMSAPSGVTESLDPTANGPCSVMLSLCALSLVPVYRERSAAQICCGVASVSAT